jgi:hypothetical protein
VFNLQSQTDPEIEQTDSTRNAMGDAGAKNYAPAYYFYINSLFPQTVEQTLIDTSIFYPYNEDISLFSRNLYATLGIFGQANFSMNFAFNRKHGFNYKTLPYNDYLRTIENWRFYALDEVYSHLQYNFANGKENHFSVEHAQQITEDLHFGLALESVIAEGRYVRQKMRDVNVGGTLRYKLPSNRYGFNAYYYLNYVNPQENGGLVNDADFKKDSLSPQSINVRFSSLQASNKLFQNTFFFRHYLSLSGKADSNNVVKNKGGYLVHDMEYSTSRNLFSARNLYPAYSDMFLFDSAVTYDQTKYINFRTGLFWSTYMPEDTFPDKRNFIRFAAGIMYDFHQFRDTMYTFRDNQLTPVGVLYVKLFNRLHINANALITLNGYNAGDITFEGEAGLDFALKEKAKHQLVANIGFYNYSPDYFFSWVLANNYLWLNDLKKQQTITVGVKWKHRNYSVGINYYTLNNYTLLDETSQPMQINNFVNVYQLAAYIPFHFKGFGFNSNIYLQYADDDHIRIPVFATRQTVYYGLPLFKKALYLQLGLDFLYNTSYYANAYNPVLQQFYLQDDTRIGNYGYLDFYLRAKIGRFQLQFKLTHLWAGAFGKVYYLVPHYPAKDLGFALGIAWRFHD